MQWEQGQDSIPVWPRDRVLRTHTYTCVPTQYVVTPASKHSCAYLPGCLRDGGAFLFRVVCVQASHPCIRRLCMSLSAHLSPCVCTSSTTPPPPISRAMARLPFALRLRGWEVTAVGPDSPMPTPRHTPSPRLVTSLSEASPGPVSLSPRQLSRLFPL